MVLEAAGTSVAVWSIVLYHRRPSSGRRTRDRGSLARPPPGARGAAAPLLWMNLTDYYYVNECSNTLMVICYCYAPSLLINWFSSLLFYSCRLGQVNFQFNYPSLLNCLVIYTRYLWITVSWFDRIWIWRFMFLFLFCLHTFLAISWFVIEQATIKPFFD